MIIEYMDTTNIKNTTEGEIEWTTGADIWMELSIHRIVRWQFVQTEEETEHMCARFKDILLFLFWQCF